MWLRTTRLGVRVPPGALCPGGGIWQTRGLEGAMGFSRVGSSPTPGTNKKLKGKSQKSKIKNQKAKVKNKKSKGKNQKAKDIEFMKYANKCEIFN